MPSVDVTSRSPPTHDFVSESLNRRMLASNTTTLPSSKSTAQQQPDTRTCLFPASQPPHSTSKGKLFLRRTSKTPTSKPLSQPFEATPIRHAAIPAEKWRDLSGVFTLHRLSIFIWVAVLMTALFYLQDYFWKGHAALTPSHTSVLTNLSGVWCGALVPLVFVTIGLLWFHHNTHLDQAPRCPNSLVVFRIVTRGTNEEALLKTVQRCQDEMNRTPLFPFVVEILTDVRPKTEPSDRNVLLTVVPREYRTKRGALYKARALQYAMEYSPVPDSAWLVHLDEESHPTSSMIKGIALMVHECERTRNLNVIGQGAIVYHRDWEKHPYLTLADNLKTGIDFTTYYFQHRIGLTIFGLHGSFIVCRNDYEKQIGFDFGPEGSITEDAFFGLCAMQNGARTKWVDGYMEEQATQSVIDFLKQRRRWFLGLIKVCRYAPVSLKWRWPITLQAVSFFLSPFAFLYSLFYIMDGHGLSPMLRIVANFAFAFYCTVQIAGLQANLIEHGTPFRKWPFWIGLQILLFPLFSGAEALSIAYALLKPDAGFHIVKK